MIRMMAFVCSLPQRGSIGDRMFTSGWQLTLMKRMKKRLTETADFYRNLASNSESGSTQHAEVAHTALSAQQRELYEKLDRFVLSFGHFLHA